MCVKLQEMVKLHEKKLAEQEKRIMELESKQAVNEFKAMDCLQAPSTTRPRDQAELGVDGQPMQAKQEAQTIPSLSEDGQQQRKYKFAVDNRESSHDSSPGQTDNAKLGPVGVVSNKASAVTKDISFARAVKGPDKSEVPILPM